MTDESKVTDTCSDSLISAHASAHHRSLPELSPLLVSPSQQTIGEAAKRNQPDFSNLDSRLSGSTSAGTRPTDFADVYEENDNDKVRNQHPSSGLPDDVKAVEPTENVKQQSTGVNDFEPDSAGASKVSITMSPGINNALYMSTNGAQKEHSLSTGISKLYQDNGSDFNLTSKSSQPPPTMNEGRADGVPNQQQCKSSDSKIGQEVTKKPYEVSDSSSSDLSLSDEDDELEYIEVVNDSETQIEIFENFIHPKCTPKMQMPLLRHLMSLKFSEKMKIFDLSTPPSVRLIIEDVLTLLRETMQDHPIKEVYQFILPNVARLDSANQAITHLREFIEALNCSVRIVEGRFDEVSNDFENDDGNLGELLQRYNETEFRLTSMKKCKNKPFKTFCILLCSQEQGQQIKDNYLKDSLSTEDCQLEPKLKSCWDKAKYHGMDITGKGVMIAFLDSGIHFAHEVFQGRTIVVNDITGSGSIDLLTDYNGHGTGCASIACGGEFTHKCFGKHIMIPAGVAPDANIVMYKIINKQGRADPEVITKALQQCLKDKEKYSIDIVLLPYGSDAYILEIADVIRELINARVLVVTASGNSGIWKKIPYPSRSGYTICAGAHDEYGVKTKFTRTGQALDFLAPGENILAASSVHPSAFSVVEGTSFAAAHVAGLLALIIHHARNISKEKSLSLSPSVEELVHSQDVIKTVLRKMLVFSEDSRGKDCGFGCLELSTIFCNTKLLELLYEDIAKDPKNS